MTASLVRHVHVPVPRSPAGPRDRAMRFASGVCALFGAGWSLWAASGLTQAAAVVCRGVGFGVAVVVLVVDGTRWRHAGPGSGSRPTTDRRYWTVNLAELVLVVAGALVLVGVGRPQLVIAWTAAVVGAHFVVLARWYWRGFAVLGTCMLIGAVLGVVLAAVQPALLIAVTGMVAASALLSFAVLTSRRG